MLNKIRKLQNKKGFTLVELIVVIAIIAILTAVIVPLVGRYSAQATYTTLNDAATTVSSSANTAMSSATMMGSVCATVQFTGSKDATGSLTISSNVTGATATLAANGTPIVSATGASADQKACDAMVNSLAATLPNGARFIVTVNSNAVTGVVYTTDASLALSDSMTLTRVDGFENAYQSGNVAVGASGRFIPATT